MSKNKYFVSMWANKQQEFEKKLVKKALEETNKLKIVQNFTRARLMVSKTKEGIKEGFAKSHRAKFTRDTYKIIKQTGPNSFELDVPPGEVKIWQPHSLKILSEEESRKENDKKEPYLMLSTGEWIDPKKPAKKTSKRVNLRVASAKQMEEQNISAKELKANLVATRLRSSRVATRSSKKVDYRKMAGLQYLHI